MFGWMVGPTALTKVLLLGKVGESETLAIYGKFVCQNVHTASRLPVVVCCVVSVTWQVTVVPVPEQVQAPLLYTFVIDANPGIARRTAKIQRARRLIPASTISCANRRQISVAKCERQFTKVIGPQSLQGTILKTTPHVSEPSHVAPPASALP